MNYVNGDYATPKSVALDAPAQVAQARWTIPYRAIAPLAMTIDASAIFLTSVLTSVFYHVHVLGLSSHIEQFAGFAAVVAALFIAIANNRDLYAMTALLNFKLQARKITALWIVVFFFLTAIAFVMKVSQDFSRGAALSFAILGLMALILSRACWRVFLADGLAVRRLSGRNVVVISDETNDSPILETLVRHGLEVAQHFVLPEKHTVEAERKVVAQAIAAVRGSNIQEIVVTTELERWPELKTLLADLRVLPLPVNLFPIGPMAELFRLHSHTIGDDVTIELQRGPRTLVERAVKRVVDIAVAIIGLVIFSPLLVMTAVAIKLDSRGPIFFRQRRCGFNGRPFQILKFRTMSVLEDGDSIEPAKPNDIRITRIGALLRRTSIDELPQLINVLHGDMSIVGPRPHAMAHDDAFEKLVEKYPYRQQVKPGLTGWAQVHGQRGEAKTPADIEQRLQFDLWYIDNWSLAFDFRIMLMTLVEVVRGRNAY